MGRTIKTTTDLKYFVYCNTSDRIVYDFLFDNLLNACIYLIAFEENIEKNLKVILMDSGENNTKIIQFAVKHNILKESLKLSDFF